jgi:cobalt/nickel transport system ATP-binding protein
VSGGEAGAPLLHLDDVHFSYDAERKVLSGASLTLRAGERLAIEGANGAGKTTLLHLVVGLLRPSAGRIVAFGRERRRERDFREVRARAGLLFQDADDQLFCPTVLEDVAFGPLNLGRTPDEARAIAEATLAEVGLVGFGQRITSRLSGGEKRLVTLACVLAMRPDALLLDEPTTGLDERAEAGLLKLLRALPQAMLIVSHDCAFRDALADGRLLLRDGRLERG